jgi:hypothetical protein
MAAGVVIINHNYQQTALHSIPDELAKFTLGLLSSACIVNPSAIIDTNTLINHICKEAEWLKIGMEKTSKGEEGPSKKDSRMKPSWPQEAMVVDENAKKGSAIIVANLDTRHKSVDHLRKRTVVAHQMHKHQPVHLSKLRTSP